MKSIIKKALLFTILFSSVISANAEFRVVGYIPSYRWSAIASFDFNDLTHVCISFVNPNSAGEFSFGQDIPSLQSAVSGTNCKIFAAIGGGGPSSEVEHAWMTLTADSTRSHFISQLMDFVRQHNLDGIDVDLEGSLVQMSNYNGYVQELADSVHAAGLEISAALAQWTNSYVDDATADALDFLNVMAYDKKGPWQPFSPGQHSSYSHGFSDYNYWVNRGQANDKVVLGVPFYGYEFTGTSDVPAWTWCQIVTSYPDSLYQDQIVTSDGTVYFNGKKTIQDKTQLMMDVDGGGIMVWEIGQDCVGGDHSLMEIIHHTLDGTISTQKVESKVISLVPNPSRDVVTVTNISGQFSYEIISQNGILCQNGGQNTPIIDVSALKPGVYGLKLIQNNQLFTEKLIKL